MGNKALKGLTIKIGGDTTDLEKSLNKIDSQSGSLSKELGQINKLLKLDPTNTDLLAQKQKVLADAIASTENKLGALREAEKQVQAQFERGEVSEEQYRALQREIIATEQKLGKYKDAAKETTEAEQKLADGSVDASKGMDKAGNSSETAAGKFDTAAVAAAAALAAVVSLGKESVEAFNEVDEGADNVVRATGATGAAAGNLVESYKKVATQVVASLDEIGATVGEVNTRFGYTGKLLEECSTDFLKFAEITGVNSTDAVKMVTRALNDAGIPLSDYKILLDQLAKAGQSAGIDVTALADGLSKNGATMRAMGFDTAETISLLAQFELSGADATTMLSGMKKAMGTWAKSGKDGRVEFAKLVEGVKIGSVSSSKALEVFGTRAGPQLVDAIKSGKFEYSKMLSVLKKSEGTLDNTFGELEDGGYSVQRSFQALKVKAGDLGEEIMDATAPALEELLDYLTEEDVVNKFGNAIKNDIVPSLKNISGWVSNNGPAIKTTVAGVTAALVAYKAATLAATVAHNGIKGAIMATTVAQKALALTQAATPWGLAAVAIAGVTTALVALATAQTDGVQPTEFLTEKELELVAASKEAAVAFRDQKEATQETLGGINSQMDYLSGLVSELDALADSTGKVKEADEARVKFILNELKEATGEEYKLVDGTIQKYDELKTSIKDVIAQKTANLLMEAVNADFVQAIQEEGKAWEAVQLAQKQYDEQLDLTKQKEQDYETFKDEYNRKLASGYYDFREAEQAADSQRMLELEEIWKEEQGHLTTRQEELNTAAGNYSLYADRIASYELAQEQAAMGNYEAVRDILTDKNSAYTEHADTVESETDRALEALKKEAADAGYRAERIKEEFDKGTEGFSEEMVKEAEEAYAEAMAKFENAYADAKGVGEDLDDGMVKGMENKRPSLLQKARDLVKGIISAMRKEADSHSPSKKTIAFGEDVGEGPVIGIQRKIPDAKKAATKQVAAIIEAYKAPPDVTLQQHLTAVETSSQALAAQAAASNAAQLDKILAAIERGQVLVLDGDTLVGATAGRMDNTLGQRRVLITRGAL